MIEANIEEGFAIRQKEEIGHNCMCVIDSLLNLVEMSAVRK